MVASDSVSRRAVCLRLCDLNQQMDKFDRATRSRVMGKSRSTGSKSTERRMRSLLARAGVRGWKLGHDSGLPGRPDIIFPKARLATFVDGCFWHGCTRCRSIPKTNTPFWQSKIRANRERDRKVVRLLRRINWQTLRIWEHECRDDSDRVLRQLMAATAGMRSRDDGRRGKRS